MFYLMKSGKKVQQKRKLRGGAFLFWFCIPLQMCLAETIHEPMQFEWSGSANGRGGHHVSFLFETNGTYSVTMEYSLHEATGKTRLDVGRWIEQRPDRIKMISSKLLFKPMLEYDTMSVEISTYQEFKYWLPVVNDILNDDTNRFFSAEVVRKIFSRGPSFDEREEETKCGETSIRAPSVTRVDLESFRRDLTRLQSVPVWWEVVCEVVNDDGTVKLMPEKGKKDYFEVHYSMRYHLFSDKLATNDFPRLKKK